MVEVSSPIPLGNPPLEVSIAHSDHADEVEVWNTTIKGLRLPNNQYIRPLKSTRVRGWGIWKSDDIVQAWLACGAITETDPEAAPPPGDALPTFTSLSPAPSVFTGRIEPPRRPSGSPQGAREGLGQSSPSQAPSPAAPGPVPAGPVPSPQA